MCTRRKRRSNIIIIIIIIDRTAYIHIIYVYDIARIRNEKKKKRFAKSVAGKSSRRFRLLPVICRAHDNASWARASVLARNRVRCLYIVSRPVVCAVLKAF